MECLDTQKIIISTKEENTKIRITSLEECANRCRGISTTFSFGTGFDGCSVHGCNCKCELETKPDGWCKSRISSSKGMKLYRFDQGKNFIKIFHDDK